MYQYNDNVWSIGIVHGHHCLGWLPSHLYGRQQRKDSLSEQNAKNKAIHTHKIK